MWYWPRIMTEHYQFFTGSFPHPSFSIPEMDNSDSKINLKLKFTLVKACWLFGVFLLDISCSAWELNICLNTPNVTLTHLTHFLYYLTVVECFLVFNLISRMFWYSTPAVERCFSSSNVILTSYHDWALSIFHRQFSAPIFFHPRNG